MLCFPLLAISSLVEKIFYGDMLMLLSVIIPTHNRLEILKKCLNCLEKQTVSPDLFEVIVIDDASTDETSEFLQQYSSSFQFKHFRQAIGDGPAKARNVGILAAQGEIILILNDDALLAPDAMAVHLAVHQGIGQDISVLGRFDLPEHFSATLWGYVLQHSDILFRFPALEHNKLYGGETYWTCNISTPRRALLAAGLFDEDFCGGAWGAEDQELGARLFALKVPVLFRDDCRAVHEHCLTVDGYANMGKARGGGGVILFAKHNLVSHYSQAITNEDIYFWRNIPARLAARVRELHELLRETETITLPARESMAPYLAKADFPEATKLAYSLIFLRTRDLLEVIDSCMESTQALLSRIKGEDIGIEGAARLLYPICLIMRYYHDSIGVCAGKAIETLAQSVNSTRS